MRLSWGSASPFPFYFVFLFPSIFTLYHSALQTLNHPFCSLSTGVDPTAGSRRQGSPEGADVPRGTETKWRTLLYRS